ncbi:MAG: ExbD/TolR family protein [Phycisphaerales bacterium]
MSQDGLPAGAPASHGAKHALEFAAAEDAPPVFGVAPLVDVVLLLIAFYLLVMKSMDARSDTAVELPVATLVSAAELAPAELICNLLADGSVVVNAMPVEDHALVGHFADAQLQAAEMGQSLRLVIRSDRQQSFARLDDVMTAARDAGIGAIAVRTQTGEQ